MKSKVQLDPLNIIRAELLKIKVKQTGQVMRLRPSYTQRRLLRVVETLRQRNKPVRIHALKARQVYFSTIVEALFFSLASQTTGINGMVLADDDEGSTYLFDMQRLMQTELEKDYPFLVERTKRNSEQKLEWARLNSWIMTETANNLKAGRKYTLHYVHMSESAYFRDYDTLTDGLYQAVPEEPGTIIIDESTANGMSGGFYDGVMSCYPPNGSWDEELQAWIGADGWVLLFIAWYEHPEYRLPLIDGQLEPVDGIQFETQKERQAFLVGEESLAEVLRAHANKLGTPETERTVQEQLNWRRMKIKKACKGSVLVFNQEYPESVDVAFIASGRPVLSPAIVAKNLRLTRFSPPKYVGNFEWANEWKDDAGRRRKGPNVVNDVCVNAHELAVKFVPTENGRWRVWSLPEAGWENRYCIPSDTAEGLTHGNYSTGMVIDRMMQRDVQTDFLQVIATLNLHLDVDEHAEELVKAAIYYNGAVLAIERNNHGLAVIKRAWMMYRRHYFRANFSKGWPEYTNDVGWQTTPGPSGTRSVALTDFKEWVDKERFRVPDTHFWQQARTFVEDERGRMAAQGKHSKRKGAVKEQDDLVMTAAIGLQIHFWMPVPTKTKEPVIGWRKRLHGTAQPQGANAL